jgi:hypothetical protein
MLYKAGTVSDAIIDVFHRHEQGPSAWIRPGEIAKKVLRDYVFPFAVDEQAIVSAMRGLRRRDIGIRAVPMPNGFSSNHHSFCVNGRYYFAEYRLTPEAREVKWTGCSPFDSGTGSSEKRAISIGRQNVFKRKSNRRRRLSEQQRFIYYIRWETAPKYVKIGFSARLEKRLQNFFTACPSNLEIIRLQPATCLAEECAIHETFDEYRHRGEWFLYEGELRAFISNLDTGPAIDFFANKSTSLTERLVIHYF